jgi:3-oxoadipate CoA-transferase alpha subunit
MSSTVAPHPHDASKVVGSADVAVAVIQSGATVLVGGFGDSGVPFQLLEALARRCIPRLTIVSNNCGTGEHGLPELFKNRMVSRVLASFPIQPGNHHFRDAHAAGITSLELVPQGTLAERLRAGGAGIGGFFTPTAAGTALAAGREVRIIDGRPHVFEHPIRGDVALVRAHVSDGLGNLRYRRAARNFNPVMAMASRWTIAEVDEIVEVGAIDPDDVHTSAPFVDALVLRSAT